MSIKIINEDIAKEISGKLLEISAIKLSIQKPFKWSSGWNSPIYCDNRLSLSYPDIRTKIKNYLSLGIQGYFPKADVIAGVATAGILMNWDFPLYMSDPSRKVTEWKI